MGSLTRKITASSDTRFTKPVGPKLTCYDLELYAKELNEGSMRGWYVGSQEGRAALLR